MTDLDVLYLGTDPEGVTAPVSGVEDGESSAVCLVRSTSAARSRLAAAPFDRVVVDHPLPGGDLAGFLREVREREPDVSIVVNRRDAAEPSLDPSLYDAAVERSGKGSPDRTRRIRHGVDAPTGGGVDGTSTGSDRHGVGGDGNAAGVAAEGTVEDAVRAEPSVPGGEVFVETVLDELVDIFFVFDLDMRFVRWNRRLPAVTGYDDDEIAGMEPFDLIADDHRETASRGVEEILDTGQATAEFDLVTRDDERIPYSWTGSLVRDGDGDPRYVCGIGRDITDRLHKEAELRRERDLVRRIFGTSPTGIMVLDPEGVVTRANARANEILGRSERNLVGRSYGDLPLTATDDDGTLDPIEEVLDTGDPVMDVRQRVGIDDGERWVSTNAAPLAGDGDVGRVIVTLTDVTGRVERRRQLEDQQEELDEMVEELRRSNAELEQFAYVASHDLKEPLRVVSNYLQLLERRHADGIDDEALEFVELAVDGAQRMRNRVDDLLTYSRIDRRGGALEPVDCEEVVGTALSSLAISIRETDAEVTVDDLPTVVGDEDQLVQLFQNLLANAVEHAGEDPPRVHVSAERDGDEAVVAVADRGVGIPPERQDRIFDLFYAGDDSDSTGLGLAICRKIVERHGGRIRVTSEPGAGSTFHVALPVPDDG